MRLTSARFCLLGGAILVAIAGQGPEKVGLRDFAQVTSELGPGANIYLDGDDWELRCEGPACYASARSSQPLPASVPGDLLSDLERNGLIGDPLYENNFKDESNIWNHGSWVYSKWFHLPEPQGFRFLLVLDGVKMGARIRFDGELVETVRDQFLRYIVPLRNISKKSLHQVSVSFESDVDEEGRFMASSGGWDWAPYTGTFKGKRRTMSKGIWKSVYIVPTRAGAVMTHIVPQILFQDADLRQAEPLCDVDSPMSRSDCFRDWRFKVRLRTHLAVFPDSQPASLELHAAWRPGKPLPGRTAKRIQQEENEPGHGALTMFVVDFEDDSLDADSRNVRLWWPNGRGNQTRYQFSVCFPQQAEVSCTARSIGFRSVSLVTGNDTDAEYRRMSRGAEGSSTHGLYLRVNGEIIYARGSNVIPMDELEARYNDKAHRLLVASAAASGMNFVRVWGGGVFLPSVFYEACDAHGIVVFQDMMYAQGGHSPRNSLLQAAEIRHQVRRLSAHPSIGVWNGCNECLVVPYTPSAVYATFVLATVIQEDLSRAVWPSCPSNGWEKGVHRLTSLPLGHGAKLVPRVFIMRRFEVHGPYQHGTGLGFPTVNGPRKFVPFQTPLPPDIDFSADKEKSARTGPGFPSTFVSEFGAVTMSSYESMAPTLHPAHHALHGGAAQDRCHHVNGLENACKGANVMAERNYACDSLIISLFGQQAVSHSALGQVGEQSFRAQLYLCMLAQALHLKAVIEAKRAANEFGCVTWQLNEIWPTGGWGSLEYGSSRNGQVLGGRWKILHHWFQETLFHDEIVACGKNEWCFFRRDATSRPGDARLSVIVHDVQADGTVHPVGSFTPAGLDFQVQPFRTRSFSLANSTVLRIASVIETGPDPSLVEQNVMLMDTPEMVLPLLKKAFPHVPRVFANVGNTSNADGSIDIHIGLENAPPGQMVLYIYLTSLAQGQFSTNGFVYIQGVGLPHCLLAVKSRACSTIFFKPHNPNDLETMLTLRTTLRIQHLQKAVTDLDVGLLAQY